jgi:hypothetical protein
MYATAYTVIVGAGIIQSAEQIGYGLGDREFGIRFPAETGHFSLLCNVQTSSAAHPASRTIGTESVSSTLKWQGREADHSPPCIVEIRTCGAIPPLPHMSSWRGALLLFY